MNSMTMNLSREACTVEACVHDFHDIDRNDPEAFAFHEAAPIVVVDAPLETVEVRVTRFSNERQWYVDSQVMKAMTVEESLALADALRVQAGLALRLTEEVDG